MNSINKGKWVGGKGQGAGAGAGAGAKGNGRWHGGLLQRLEHKQK